MRIKRIPAITREYLYSLPASHWTDVVTHKATFNLSQKHAKTAHWSKGCSSIKKKWSQRLQSSDFLFNDLAVAGGLSLVTVCGISGGICFIRMWHRMTLIQIQLQESISSCCTARHVVNWQVDLCFASSIVQEHRVKWCYPSLPKQSLQCSVMHCKEHLRFVAHGAMTWQMIRSQYGLSLHALFIVFQWLLCSLWGVDPGLDLSHGWPGFSSVLLCNCHLADLKSLRDRLY